jgi:hypothetical protein
LVAIHPARQSHRRIRRRTPSIISPVYWYGSPRTPTANSAGFSDSAGFGQRSWRHHAITLVVSGLWHPVWPAHALAPAIVPNGRHPRPTERRTWAPPRPRAPRRPEGHDRLTVPSTPIRQERAVATRTGRPARPRPSRLRAVSFPGAPRAHHVCVAAINPYQCVSVIRSFEHRVSTIPTHLTHLHVTSSYTKAVSSFDTTSPGFPHGRHPPALQAAHDDREYAAAPASAVTARRSSSRP